MHPPLLLHRVAVTHFGRKLQPGAGCADHSNGICKGWNHVFPDVPLSGCWPHIAWGMSYAKKGYPPKGHKLFQQVQDYLHELHTSQTVGMWDVLVQALGAEWGDKDRVLNTLWSERLVSPCNNWYLGFCSVPAWTPSNQPQESWHNAGVMLRLAGQLRGSTEHVLQTALPKVMMLDGACSRTSNLPISCHISA